MLPKALARVTGLAFEAHISRLMRLLYSERAWISYQNSFFPRYASNEARMTRSSSQAPAGGFFYDPLFSWLYVQINQRYKNHESLRKVAGMLRGEESPVFLSHPPIRLKR